MNSEITASFAWTADELIKASENHRRAQCRPGYRKGLVFLSLVAILAGWGSYQKHGWALPTIAFPLAGIYFLFLRKYEARWSLRRHFKKRPDQDMKITWTLGDDSFAIKTGETEGKSTWRQLAKVRKASDGFLLYPNESLFHWLPTAAFATDDDRKAVESLLRAKVLDFAEIK